jgi:chromatin remodeling complex protein RSC6
MKKIWEYIKAHKLQSVKNKRLITPDKKLAKVFGSTKSIDMMKLPSVLGAHLIDKK